MKYSDVFRWTSSVIAIVLFCSVGFMLAASTLRKNDNDPAASFLPLLMELVVGGFVFYIMMSWLVGWHWHVEDRLLRKQHREPWMWDGDWARGVIEDVNPEHHLANWFLVAYASAVAAPVVPALWTEFARDGITWGMLSAIFPLLGVLVLSMCIYSVLHQRKFGTSRFEMTTMPGAIGGQLAGVIRARFRSLPEEGVQLRLACNREVTTGHGKHRRTTTTLIWSDETTVPESNLRGELITEIPVSFAIPEECAATTMDDEITDCVEWTLEARAKLPGLDYIVDFKVPVFRVEPKP